MQLAEKDKNTQRMMEELAKQIEQTREYQSLVDKLQVMIQQLEEMKTRQETENEDQKAAHQAQVSKG